MATSQHSLVVDTTVQLIGVALAAILADMSPNIGKIMVIIMVGFLIVWMFTNVSYLSTLVSRA